MNQTERFLDAFQHESRRQVGAVRRVTASGVEGVMGVAYDPSGSMVAGW
jgi:predicted metal-dependent TIM-barrel fold hydrolase